MSKTITKNLCKIRNFGQYFFCGEVQENLLLLIICPFEQKPVDSDFSCREKTLVVLETDVFHVRKLDLSYFCLASLNSRHPMQKNELQQIFNQLTFTIRRTHNDTSCLEIENYVTNYLSLRTDTCGWYLRNLAFLENQRADARKKNRQVSPQTILVWDKLVNWDRSFF